MAGAIYYMQNPAAPIPNRPPRYGSAVVLCADGKILLEHRKDDFSWGLISGDIHQEETFRQCGVRKTLEETGIHIRESQLKPMKLFDDPTRIVSFEEGNIYRVISVGYSIDLFAIPEVVCSEQSIELRFIDPMDLDSYQISLIHQDILEEYLRQSGCEYQLSRRVWRKE